MKKVKYENMYNKEQFVINGKMQTKFIDGVEYIKMSKPNSVREVLVRKDYLRKIIGEK